MIHCVFVCFQSKYKEAGRKQASGALYSLLPETLETQHAKDATDLLSQVEEPLLYEPRDTCQDKHTWKLIFALISDEIQGGGEERGFCQSVRSSARDD